MSMNPWLVESVHSFLYLKCPECVFETKYENEEIFQYHALGNHSWSNVLFGDMVKVDPNENENHSIKQEKYDEYETYDYRYDAEITPDISISNPVSELKVECLEGDNKVFVHEEQYTPQEKEQLKGSGFNKLEHLYKFQALEEKHGPFQRENGVILCSHCPKSFDRPARLNEHIVAVHEGKKPYSCTLCEKSYGLKSNLRIHIDSAHGESKRHKCSSCEKDFANRGGLKRHVQVAHDRDIQDEEEVNEKDQLRGSGFNKLEYLVSFQALEEKHGPFKRENGLLLCSYCTYKAERPAKLKEHIVAVHEGKKPYKCSYCEQSFGMKRNLKLHIDSAHGNAQRHKCTLCEKDFAQKSSLKVHFEVVHEKNKPLIKCTACDFSSIHQQTINRHFESKHEEKKYSCTLCDAVYSRKQTLNTHVKTFHKDISQNISQNSSNGIKKEEFDNKIYLTKPFQCLNCPESFISKYDLNIHNKSVHGGAGPQKCLECDFSCTRKEMLVRHVKTEHEGIKLEKRKTNLPCNLCDTEFTDLPSFKEHINSVHDGNKPHKCTVCDQSYFLRYSLKTHIARIHEGIKPRKGPKAEHLCKICNSIFDKKYKLINHNVKEHDGQMPYLCTLCGGGFVFLWLLEQHTASAHEGIRYDCTLCDSNFTMEKSLKKHMEQVHEKRRPHLCTICGTGSKTKQALELHMKYKHTGEKPHMCSICGSSFVARSTLLQHMRNVHEKLKPFSCPEESCAYTASLKQSLRRHIECVHLGIKRPRKNRDRSKKKFVLPLF